MRKALTNNIGLKILAIIIAVIVWIAVVEINDPVTTTKFYDVPVTLRNEDSVTEDGLVYTVEDNTDLVTLTVTAPRSVLSDLDTADFSIIADLSERNASQEVEIKATSSKRKVENIALDHKYLKLETEDLITRQITVELTPEGIPMTGYAVGEVSASPNQITISGPASVMSRVARVTASLNVDGCFETLQSNCRVTLLDAKGAEVSRDRISFSDEDILVTASFLPTKTIDLKFATSGTPALGYGAISITSDPEVITICGQSADIANLAGISVPAEELDVTGLDKNLEKTINVEQYLPDNIKILSADGGNVKVKVLIKKLNEKILNVPVADVTVKNLRTGLSYSFVDENGNQLQTIPIKVLGIKEDLEKITEKDIKIVLDANGLGVGKQQIQAEITVPSGMQTDETWISLMLTR